MLSISCSLQYCACAVLNSVCPPAAISSISHYSSVQYACCFCVLVSQSCWLVYLSVVYTHILAYCVNVTYRKACFVPLGSYWRICSFLGAGKSMSTPQDLFRSSGKVFPMQAWHHIAPSHPEMPGFWELEYESNTNCVDQGYSNLAHEIHFPADLSSNPNQTHLSMLINVFRIIRKSQVGEFEQGCS